MIEIFGYPIGTLSQLLTTIFSGGLLAAILPFLLGYRKVSLDAEGLLRTHFADTLKTMQGELSQARTEINAATVRQRECEERESALRGRVRELEDHLEGVYRMLVQTNAEKVIEMGAETFPQHIVDLATRTIAYSKAKP